VNFLSQSRKVFFFRFWGKKWRKRYKNNVKKLDTKTLKMFLLPREPENHCTKRSFFLSLEAFQITRFNFSFAARTFATRKLFLSLYSFLSIKLHSLTGAFPPQNFPNLNENMNWREEKKKQFEVFLAGAEYIFGFVSFRSASGRPIILVCVDIQIKHNFYRFIVFRDVRRKSLRVASMEWEENFPNFHRIFEGRMRKIVNSQTSDGWRQ
jgi:hypothetical protein